MSSVVSTTPGVTPGPVPLSRVWSRGRVIAEDLTGEDLSDVLQHNEDASAWWVLPRDRDYGAAELRGVAAHLDLDDLALRDLLAEDRRAKFEAVGGARLVVTNYVTHDPDRLEVEVHPISIIATDRALICLVDEAGFSPGRMLQSRAHDLAEGGVELGLRLLVLEIIKTYEDAARWLESASDQLSEALFADGGGTLGKDDQLDAFKLRRALTHLRRSTEPMRGVMTDLLDEPVPTTKGGKRPHGTSTARHWRVLSERHTRVANAADALREVLTSVFDTSLALADVRMNTIMKKLTAWAAIIAVPTLITGFAGMNVAFPLDGTTAGFWVALVVLVLSSLVLYMAFRRRDWL